jgi:hypothetical protein
MARNARLSFLSLAILPALLWAPADGLAAEEGLALVPTDAASVGVIRLGELRASPLASRIFEDTDRIASDGDAARFLEEAGLDPKRDVDVVVVSAIPGRGPQEHVLVLFEGRFDPARLSAAVINRGAAVRVADDTEYYLIDEGEHRKAAVAFVSRGLVIAGDEGALVRALSDRRRGGSGFLSGEGLGSSLSRIDRRASAWALVDARRFPAGRRNRFEEGERSTDPARALVGAMKSVTLYAVQATARSEELEFTATGVTADEETQELLEDALRGVIAAWRIALSEKKPELVSVIRRFRVTRDDDGVTIRGTLPASFLQTVTARRHARNATE